MMHILVFLGHLEIIFSFFVSGDFELNLLLVFAFSACISINSCQIFILIFPKKSSRFFLKNLLDFSIEKELNNHKSMVVEFLCFTFYAIMLMIVQWALIDAATCARREVVWNSVKASFTEVQQSKYEVLLEVSSNKFLLNMVTDAAWAIQWFEVVAVKWFMELSRKVIDVLKKLVAHLWNMCD